MKNKKGRLKNQLKTIVKCPNHPDKPAWARGLCKNCYDKWLKINNPKYAERQRENCREWSDLHSEQCRKNSKDWVAKQDKTYNWARSLRYLYGITPDDYNRILEAQKGVCNICGIPPKSSKRLAVDHCHETGKIRGLLCFRCNFGLSFFGESEEILAKAAAHVRIPK